MVLNRAAKREAESRLRLLRKVVTLEVFTLRFEDSVCRETRQAAEELAELSSRLAVEVSDASESGDLLRRYRVDAIPCLTVTAKDSPEYRLYGVPLGYALISLLDAINVAGGLSEPKPELVTACAELQTLSHSPRLDLVLSRRAGVSAEASATLWRVVQALRAAKTVPEPVASVRLAEDFPIWAASRASSSAANPVLFLNEEPALAWPFIDLDIVALLASK